MQYVRMRIVITVAALILATSGHDQLMAAQLCGGMALKILNTTITLAQTIAAGDFAPPAPLPPAGPFGTAGTNRLLGKAALWRRPDQLRGDIEWTSESGGSQ